VSWVNSSAVLTATHTFFPVAIVTFKMLTPLDASSVIIAVKFVVQFWHWNRWILLVSSTPAGPKLVSSIVNKYGSSSARTVPVTLKYVFHINCDWICVNVREKKAMCLIRLLGLDKNLTICFTKLCHRLNRLNLLKINSCWTMRWI